MVYALSFGTNYMLTQYLDDRGPMQEYNSRVASGKLRDDEHQRGL